MWVIVQYSLYIQELPFIIYSSSLFCLIRMPPYVGIEVDFGPTAKAREIWQASMSHVNLKGGCFVLTANQFCKREDNLLSLVNVFCILVTT